jgi:mRNA-degrading endonuclease toxin of MazEF toxin-antitoxin module
VGRIRLKRISERALVPSIERFPRRGEIWFAQLPADPPEKGRRPVVVVSLDARNRHERANTVLVIPLTTSIHKDAPTHVYLSAGETGLQSDSAARPEDITVVRKGSLVESRSGLRRLSDRRVCEMAHKVLIATGCAP